MNLLATNFPGPLFRISKLNPILFVYWLVWNAELHLTLLCPPGVWEEKGLCWGIVKMIIISISYSTAKEESHNFEIGWARRLCWAHCSPLLDCFTCHTFLRTHNKDKDVDERYNTSDYANLYCNGNLMWQNSRNDFPKCVWYLADVCRIRHRWQQDIKSGGISIDLNVLYRILV